MKPTDRRLPPLPDPGLPVRLLQHRHTATSPRWLVFPILYICLLRLGGHPIASAVIALILVEITLVLFSVAIKKSLVGSEWGSDHSTPFWSWRHFAYFFAQDCFFVWCRSPLAFCAGTVLANSILRWMGCHIGHRTIVTRPMQCSDWNAVNFGNDCVIDGFLQFHTLENMMLKVKRTHIQDGCSRRLRRHGDGRRGHRAGHNALAVVPGPQGDEHAHRHLRGEPRGACEPPGRRECTTPCIRRAHLLETRTRLTRLTTPTG